MTGTLSGNPGPIDDIRRSPNCGVPIKGAAVQLGNYTVATDAIWNGGAPVKFRTAADTNPAGARNAQATTMLSTAGSSYRCYLGGDPRLAQQSWPNVNAAAWAAVQGNWAGTGRRLEASSGLHGRAQLSRPSPTGRMRHISGPSAAPTIPHGKA